MHVVSMMLNVSNPFDYFNGTVVYMRLHVSV